MNFNPRTPCGVRHFPDVHIVPLNPISIHAPRAGCDKIARAGHSRRGYFNPRTPCGVRQHVDMAICRKGYFNPRTPCGVRRGAPQTSQVSPPFQSTHPVRGATSRILSPPYRSFYFNPRTPCGVRRHLRAGRRDHSRFQSTHPVRGATPGYMISPSSLSFQSTHPVRGATIL